MGSNPDPERRKAAVKRVSFLRPAVDGLMTLALLFLMGYQLWGEAAHEWVGAGMFVLWIAHHLLNRGWYRGLFRGRYSPLRAAQTLVNLLLLLAMLAQIYSGIVLSRHVFSFLPITGGAALARRLHILGPFWGFVLMSLHLGLHWGALLGMARKKAGLSPSPGRTVLCRIVGAAVALWGLLAFFRRDLPSYLFLRSEFVFLDYGEPAVRFYWDYLAIMGLFLLLGYYGSKALRALSSPSPKLPQTDGER